MIKYCLEKWNKNKGVLEQAIREYNTKYDIDYTDIVKLVVTYILNDDDDEQHKWDANRITVIDNGDWQGTQLFMIPKATYQPAEYEYLLTYQSYGSCSGCDTLQHIIDDLGGTGKPNEQQVKEYMTLCKDIVTNMIKPYNSGYWNYEEEFDEVVYK